MMLGNWSITFGNPWWLILIPLVLPPLIWTSFRSLSGLGPIRRALAILFRTAVISLIVLALAELQIDSSDRSPDDDVLARRLQQHAPRSAEGGTRLRE